MQVTSEADPFVLHTLEVSEDDFQALKASRPAPRRAPQAAAPPSRPRSALTPPTRPPLAPTTQAEQCILVDFSTFPAKIVELLQACAAAAAAPDARPRCAPRRDASAHARLRSACAHAQPLTRQFSLFMSRRDSFQAVLRAPGGAADSTLSIVETNAFKQLTHLALRCRPGNDAAVKQARRRHMLRLSARACCCAR